MSIRSAINSSGLIPLFVIGIAAAVLFSLSGVLIFADSAKPGDILYAVDRGIEKVQISLTKEKTAKAKLESVLALERAKELNQAVQSKDTKKLAQATYEHEQQLKEVLSNTATIMAEEELSLKETNEIVDNIEKQKALIDELLNTVIGEEKDSIQEAKNNADLALVTTYEQLKNRTIETKKEQSINLLTSGNEISANTKRIDLKASPGCSKGHDGYGKHLDLTIKADMHSKVSKDTVLAIIDTKNGTTAYFAVMKNGFTITEIKAHDDLGSLRGPLFRLKLEGDGREYKIQALSIDNADTYDPETWHKNIIGETSFSKNCNEENAETKPDDPTINPTPGGNSSEHQTQKPSKSSLALSPHTGTLNRGCTYNMEVELDTNGLQAGGVDVVLLYDPQKLSITSASIKKGTMFNEYLPNTWNTKPGKIEYTGLSDISTPVTGSGVFATFPFKVLESSPLGKTTIDFKFDPNNQSETTDSNIVEYVKPGSAIGNNNITYDDLLTSVTNGSYTIADGSCN